MKISKRQLKRIISENIFDDAYEYVSDVFGSSYSSYKAGDVVTTSDTDLYEYKEKGNSWVFRKKGEDDSAWKAVNIAGAKALNRQFKDEEETVQDEEESSSTEADGIQYHKNIPEKYKLADPSSVLKGKNTFIAKCSETGCAEWVGSIAGWQGNAWHEHWHDEVVDSAFFGGGITGNINTITNLFNKVNRKPEPEAFNSSVKSLVLKMIPSKSKFKNIELGSVVGLYWPSSSKFTQAFYEGATGSRKLGKKFDAGDPAGEPGFFETTDGRPWDPSMAGDKNIKFRPTDKLKSGKGFGMNTHLGFIGAYANGEPVVFHNIGPGTEGDKGRVYATPLKALSKSRMMILWQKKPKSGYFDWLF